MKSKTDGSTLNSIINNMIYDGYAGKEEKEKEDSEATGKEEICITKNALTAAQTSTPVRSATAKISRYFARIAATFKNLHK